MSPKIKYLLLAVAVVSAATAQAQSSSRLFNSQPAANERFGSALAASNRWLLVGVPNDVTAGGIRTGSAVVFEQINGQYVEHSRLIAPDGAANDEFGFAVAVDDGTAIVGAWQDSLAAGSGAGSVYVYTFNGAAWSFSVKLSAPDAATGDFFGSSVSLNGDTLLVGAPFDDLTSVANGGSAHMFVRNGGWQYATKLIAPDATPFEYFGHATGTANGNLLVSARGADGGAGAVYAFERNGLQTSFVQRLIPADRGATDAFGSALSVEGGAVLIGAPSHAEQSGAAYLFQRNGNTWSQQHKFVAPATVAQDRSGRSVALRAGVAVLGSPLATLGACCQQGAVDLFVRNGNRWQFDRRLRSDASAPFDELGSAVVLSAAGALAGAPLSQDPVSGVLDVGSVVHFYENWTLFKDGFE